MKLVLESPEKTRAFGAKLWQCTHARSTIFLIGDLGAGKTTLVRGFLNAAGFAGPVKSPTFTLVEEYPLETLQVFHFDLYRLTDPEELEWMGIRDFFGTDAVCFIEWAQRGSGFLPTPDIEIRFEIMNNSRRLTVSSFTNNGNSIEARLIQD